MSPSVRPTGRGWALMLAIGASVFVADQVAKEIVLSGLDPGERVDLILGIEIVRTSNTGIAFGLLDGAGAGLLVLVASVAVGALLFWFAREGGQRLMQVSVGLLVGGAAGNVADRLVHGRVTDFVDLPGWPPFNVADVAITAGVLALAVGLVLGEVRERRRGA